MGKSMSVVKTIPPVVQHAYFSLNGGGKAVTTAGTAVALSATTVPCMRVVVRAYHANTGIIYLGGSDVDKTTKNGIPLSAGQATIQYIENLTSIYIDATVNGEGVGFTYEV